MFKCLKSNTGSSEDIAKATLFRDRCARVNKNLFKIIVIGDRSVGKTSIIRQCCLNSFQKGYQATIGVDFVLKRLVIDDIVIVLQLWDIAGQERFGHMTRLYYKDAMGACVVFDATRPKTFTSVESWRHDLNSRVCLPDGSPIPCVLLANKCDDSEKRGIINNPVLLQQYVKEHDYTAWFETSAKENIGIDTAITKLAQAVMGKKYLFKIPPQIQTERSMERSLVLSGLVAQERSGVRGCNCERRH